MTNVHSSLRMSLLNITLKALTCLQEVSKRVPIGLQEGPKRVPRGLQEGPKRSPRGPQEGPKRAPGNYGVEKRESCLAQALETK